MKSFIHWIKSLVARIQNQSTQSYSTIDQAFLSDETTLSKRHCLKSVACWLRWSESIYDVSRQHESWVPFSKNLLSM